MYQFKPYCKHKLTFLCATKIVLYFLSGHCVCDQGFGGADCSVNITEPPKVWRLKKDGFCDISEESCDEIVVYGEYFYKSDDLECELQRIEVNGLVVK